jgi:hypothetical protein
MSGIAGVDCRRRTEELVDDWAHDAGIVSKDEHVKGRAGLRSAADAWEARNHGTKGEAAAGVAEGLAVQIAPDVAEHFMFGGSSAVVSAAGMAGAGLALGVGVAASSVYGAYRLYKDAWADPHAKGDNIRALAHNDAVNVAVASSLSFDPRFASEEAARRPGVEKNSAKLVTELHGKDAALVPILQARADEGFVAAERSLEATKSLAGTPERAVAMQRWMKDNGFEDRARNDVAFGKGAEYCVWLHGASHRGLDVAAESKKVHDRQPPVQGFACRG